MIDAWMAIIALTLLHSMWQFAAIALLTRISMGIATSASQRCWILLAGLGCCALINSATLFYYLQASTHLTPTAFSLAQAPLTATHWLHTIISWCNAHVSWLGWLWLAGFCLYLLRHCLAFLHSKYLIRLTTPAAIEMQMLATELAKQLGLKRVPACVYSTQVQVACTLGHLKPVIILPLAIITRLSQAQLQAVLLHELTHIRRHDYLINNLQCLLECIYFFNPFVRWLNHQINIEREYACDDQVIAINKDPLTYAQTIKEFIMQQPTHLSPAIGGNDHLTYTRIQRLFGVNEIRQPGRKPWLSLVLLLGAFGFSVYSYANQETGTDNFAVEVQDLAASELLGMIEGFCGKPTNAIALKYPQTKMSLTLNTSCNNAFSILQDLNNLSRGYAYVDVNGSIFKSFLANMNDSECRQLLEENIKTEKVGKFFIDTRNLPCSSKPTGSSQFSLGLQH